MIKENINSIYNDLNDSNAELIAVSKTQSIEKMKEAYDAGVKNFGENKVQELLSKIDKLPSDINWHLIGHLQTNKVKDIIGKVSLIHSIDSVKLAETIDKEANKKGIISNTLLEVNIADEPTKYGFHVNELDSAINSISKLPNIKVKGLMCVAPKTDNPEENRKYFNEMAHLKDKYNLEILSMGMSNDYKIAVQENSSYVRIGTKIFGPRNY
jgi:pyridoxal phosphate enzyme (YggS family)